MTLAAHTPAMPTARPGVSLESVGHFFVALCFLSSFFVKVEPAVCDLMFFAAMPFFLHGGLKMTPAIGLLMLGLVFYNLNGLTSYMGIDDTQENAGQWVFTSFYMSLSAVFFAAYIAQDPEPRFQFIMKYLYWGATIGSILGLIGYFHVTSFSAYFIKFERVVSTFKDPNVFSTYLILPAVAMFVSLVTGRMKMSLLNVGRMLIIAAALFLAFSRGAWTDFIVASSLALVLSFLLSPSANQRNGIVFKLVLALVAIGMLLALLLSVPAIRDLFLDRFTLVKDYDAGELGRFGNQKNSIPMLLERPLGFGPLQFAHFFREDPHNSFLNSFISFGWLGGCTFLTLVVMYIASGIKASLTRSSFQASAIVVGACLTAVLAQGFQIDSEHWRHLYWLIGITWGFFTASLELPCRNETEEDYLAGWQGKTITE